MRPLFRRSAACAAVGAILLTTAGAGRGEPDARASAARLQRVLALVSTQFVDSVSDDSLMTRTARGLVRELGDPYSTLYSPKELAGFDLSTRGRYAGLGMLLEAQEGTAVVSRVYPETPAERAGVLEGDQVVAVGALPTRGWPLDRLTDSLRGPEGSRVRVTLRRPGAAAPVERAFTRAVVHLPAVPFAARLTAGVGYVPLQQFSDHSAQETRRAVQALVAAGARGLVLDLRGNPGGLVEQAVDVAGLFLPMGADVVQVRARAAGMQTVQTTAEPAIAADLPVAVLVDGGSASAAEIVAGALQDHDRALVVGARSFGKGLVQSVYPLDGGYALKLTTARWHTPLGRALHRPRTHADSAVVDTAARRARPTVRTAHGRLLAADGGITPDVLVPDDSAGVPGARALGRAIGARGEVLARVLGELTFAYAAQTTPDGAIPPAWRAELVRRLRAGGVALTPGAADSASPALDRLLATRLLRRAYGDSAVARRYYGEDAALRTAVARLERASTTLALLAPRASGG